MTKKKWHKIRWRKTVIGKKNSSSWNWCQICIKLWTNHVMYQKLANFTKKKSIYVNRVEELSCGYPIKLNLDGLEMQKWNIPKDRAQRVDVKKWGHLSSYIYSQSYGNWSIKKGWCFVFSSDGSKKSVTVWAKYLSAPQKSYWVISGNGMVNRL